MTAPSGKNSFFRQNLQKSQPVCNHFPWCSGHWKHPQQLIQLCENEVTFLCPLEIAEIPHTALLLFFCEQMVIHFTPEGKWKWQNWSSFLPFCFCPTKTLCSGTKDWNAAQQLTTSSAPCHTSSVPTTLLPVSLHHQEIDLWCRGILPGVGGLCTIAPCDCLLSKISWCFPRLHPTTLSNLGHCLDPPKCRIVISMIIWEPLTHNALQDVTQNRPVYFQDTKQLCCQTTKLTKRSLLSCFGTHLVTLEQNLYTIEPRLVSR